MAKDPKRQLLGKIARQKGQYFEQRLDSTFDYYRERGYAEIEKTPEPMKVIKPEGNGRFLACYTKKAQVDYKGTIKGGRTVLFEAKFTATDRLAQAGFLHGQTPAARRSLLRSCWLFNRRSLQNPLG